jgi:hypothetical protein
MDAYIAACRRRGCVVATDLAEYFANPARPLPPLVLHAPRRAGGYGAWTAAELGVVADTLLALGPFCVPPTIDVIGVHLNAETLDKLLDAWPGSTATALASQSPTHSDAAVNLFDNEVTRLEPTGCLLRLRSAGLQSTHLELLAERLQGDATRSEARIGSRVAIDLSDNDFHEGSAVDHQQAKGLRALAAAVMSATSATPTHITLRLNRCKLAGTDQSTMEAIGTLALAVETLALQGNPGLAPIAGIASAAWETSFCPVYLAGSTMLRRLDVSHCNLGDRGARALVSALLRNPHIEAVNARFNDFTSAALAAFSEVALHCSNITELALGGHQADSATTVGLLLAIGGSVSIRHVDLEGLSTDGAEAISALLDLIEGTPLLRSLVVTPPRSLTSSASVMRHASRSATPIDREHAARQAQLAFHSQLDETHRRRDAAGMLPVRVVYTFEALDKPYHRDAFASPSRSARGTPRPTGGEAATAATSAGTLPLGLGLVPPPTIAVTAPHERTRSPSPSTAGAGASSPSPVLPLHLSEAQRLAMLDARQNGLQDIERMLNNEQLRLAQEQQRLQTEAAAIAAKALDVERRDTEVTRAHDVWEQQHRLRATAVEGREAEVGAREGHVRGREAQLELDFAERRAVLARDFAAEEARLTAELLRERKRADKAERELDALRRQLRYVLRGDRKSVTANTDDNEDVETLLAKEVLKRRAVASARHRSSVDNRAAARTAAAAPDRLDGDYEYDEDLPTPEELPLLVAMSRIPPPDSISDSEGHATRRVPTTARVVRPVSDDDVSRFKTDSRRRHRGEHVPLSAGSAGAPGSGHSPVHRDQFLRTPPLTDDDERDGAPAPHSAHGLPTPTPPTPTDAGTRRESPVAIPAVAPLQHPHREAPVHHARDPHQHQPQQPQPQQATGESQREGPPLTSAKRNPPTAAVAEPSPASTEDVQTAAMNATHAQQAASGPPRRAPPPPPQPQAAPPVPPQHSNAKLVSPAASPLTMHREAPRTAVVEEEAITVPQPPSRPAEQRSRHMLPVVDDDDDDAAPVRVEVTAVEFVVETRERGSRSSSRRPSLQAVEPSSTRFTVGAAESAAAPHQPSHQSVPEDAPRRPEDVLQFTRTQLLHTFPDFRDAYTTLSEAERTAFDAAFDDAHASIELAGFTSDRRSASQHRSQSRSVTPSRTYHHDHHDDGTTGAAQSSRLRLPHEPEPAMTTTPPSLREHQQSALQRTLQNCLINGLFRRRQAARVLSAPAETPSRNVPGQQPRTTPPAEPGTSRQPLRQSSLDPKPVVVVESSQSLRRASPSPPALQHVSATTDASAGRDVHSLLRLPFDNVLVAHPEAVATLQRDPGVSAMFEQWWAGPEADSVESRGGYGTAGMSASSTSVPQRRLGPGLGGTAAPSTARDAASEAVPAQPMPPGPHGYQQQPASPLVHMRAHDPRMRHLQWLWGLGQAAASTDAAEGVACAPPRLQGMMGQRAPPPLTRRDQHRAIVSQVLYRTLPSVNHHNPPMAGGGMPAPEAAWF